MSTSDHTLNEILALAAAHFKVPREKITPDDDFFKTLGINSLQALDLLTRLENHFRVELPDYELQGVSDFRTLAERIQSSLTTIGGNLARQIKNHKITEADRQAALAHITPAPDIGALGDADIVIESATENEAVKRQIFVTLRAQLKPEAILATNTSSISITRLAAATDRPEKFIGIHFMNPVPVMELVELIRGIATDRETFETAKAFVGKLGKTVTVAEDYPAFIVNRILLPMINEAIYTLYEGVGTVEAIDTAMRLGARHPMGPLELADFIGLDTCLSVMQVLYEGLADSKYRPCPLLVKYVEAGWLGKKTNRGFYDYRGEKPVPTR